MRVIVVAAIILASSVTAHAHGSTPDHGTAVVTIVPARDQASVRDARDEAHRVLGGNETRDARDTERQQQRNEKNSTTRTH